MGAVVLRFNQEEGADAPNNSGAGPSTAITGTKARNNSTATTRVGFFEASVPDLTGVLGNSTHTVYLATASGRKWFEVTAVKTTEQVTDGDTTSGSAVVTNVGSTSGMAAGDLIKIMDAGPSSAPLYATIVTVDSATQLTLNTNASATLTDKALTCPAQVTVHATPGSLSTDHTWAIGGRLNTPDVAQLKLDLLPGWTLLLESHADDSVYELSATWTASVSGTAGGGKIKLKGDKGATSVYPTLKGNGTFALVTVQADLWEIENLIFDHATAGVVLNSASARDVRIVNCDFRKQAGNTMNIGVDIQTAAANSKNVIKGCRFGDHGSRGISVVGEKGHLRVEGCLFQGSGTAHYEIEIGSALSVEILDCVFNEPAIYAVYAFAATECSFRVERCVFDACDDAVRVHSTCSRGAIIRNCVFSNNTGTALELSTDGDRLKGEVDYNCFYNNATNRVNVSAGENDLSVDPKFVDRPSLDFRAGAALKGKGWPSALHSGLSPQKTDVGLRRENVVDGDLEVLITNVQDHGTSYWIVFLVLSGALAGQVQSVEVLKTEIPASGELSLYAIKWKVAAFLRVNAVSALDGRVVDG